MKVMFQLKASFELESFHELFFGEKNRKKSAVAADGKGQLSWDLKTCLVHDAVP